MDYYRECGIPKPEPSALTKKRRDKLDARDERAAREAVRRRDHGKCRIPGCIERSQHLHHIIYRFEIEASTLGFAQSGKSLC